MLKYNCAEQHHSGLACGELNPLCGDPGCCCDSPEPGEVTDPYIEFRANCDGRFISLDEGEPCTADIFTPPCGTWVPTGVLYCPSNPDNGAFRTALSALLGAPVDYFDARNTGTTDRGDDAPVHAVYTWANYASRCRQRAQATLADYVDQGGRAILGQWCFPTAGNYLSVAS